MILSFLQRRVHIRSYFTLNKERDVITFSSTSVGLSVTCRTHFTSYRRHAAHQVAIFQKEQPRTKFTVEVHVLSVLAILAYHEITLQKSLFFNIKYFYCSLQFTSSLLFIKMFLIVCLYFLISAHFQYKLPQQVLGLNCNIVHMHLIVLF